MSSKKIKNQTLKGFRDFLPEDMVLRQKVINTLKSVFVAYGFAPLETPALEYADTLLGKYGTEADKLIYTFTDRGGRQVGLRYDQTVPLARFLASNPNLKMPFKRFQIQPVWRADKPQTGRYREFWQADIDIVGPACLLADAEVIACVLTTTKKLGFGNSVCVNINDRTVFKNLKPQEITALDKLKKDEATVSGLSKQGLSSQRAQTIAASLPAKPTALLNKLFEYLAQMGFKKNQDFVFDNRLARGLDYYTSTIFELTLAKEKLSLGGGGRYDQLLYQFTGRVLPAVGFSFGLDRLLEAVQKKNLITAPKTKTQVLVTIFSPALTKSSLKTSQALRQAAINTELYPDPDCKLDKQIKYADQKNIPLVIIIGPEENKRQKITLKNLNTGQQETISLLAAIKKLKPARED